MDEYTELILTSADHITSELRENLIHYFSIPAGPASRIKSNLGLFEVLKRKGSVNARNVENLIEAFDIYGAKQLYKLWLEYGLRHKLVTAPPKKDRDPKEYKKLCAMTYQLIDANLLENLADYFELNPSSRCRATSAVKLFQILEARGHVNKTKIDDLIDAFELYGQDQLHDMWSNYGGGARKTPKPVTPQREKVNFNKRKTTSKFALTMNISHEAERKREELRLSHPIEYQVLERALERKRQDFTQQLEGMVEVMHDDLIEDAKKKEEDLANELLAKAEKKRQTKENEKKLREERENAMLAMMKHFTGTTSNSSEE